MNLELDWPYVKYKKSILVQKIYEIIPLNKTIMIDSLLVLNPAKNFRVKNTYNLFDLSFSMPEALERQAKSDVLSVSASVPSSRDGG